MGAIAKTAKDGQAAPKGLEGSLVTRVAMGLDVLARLHQQIQQVLVGVRDARQGGRRPESHESHMGRWKGIGMSRGEGAHLMVDWLNKSIVKPDPQYVAGSLVTRVAMGVDVLARLHQQIQQVLVGMRDARQQKPKV